MSLVFLADFLTELGNRHFEFSGPTSVFEGELWAHCYEKKR